jgi:hypothetical protein
VTDHDDNWDDGVLTDDELALLTDVDALLADPAMWGSPSAEVEDQVVAVITAERAGATAPLVAGSSAAPAAVTDLSARRARRRRGWSLAGAALAGAAAAALITGIVTSRDDAGTADRAPGAASTGAPPQQLTLTGTDLAPGVAGSATLTAHPSGVEIQLDVPGLPSRDGGDFYQVWVKTCDGSLLVPAGSFHDLDDAIGWVGVSMTDFPVVTVTQESATGGKDPLQGSSGLIVASGTVGTCPS